MPEPAPGLRIQVPELVLGGRTVLRGLDLALEPGSWSCLLGPSGVGKSSLLRLVAGLIEGAVLTTSDGRGLDGRIAFMAQQDLLLPWLGALDNLLLGYRLRGAGRAEIARQRQRGRELLHRVGLAGAEDELPARLSGGMRQRVALARTLLEDRPVVLMDEPFSSLDMVTRHRLQDLAAELLRGRTVLMVTHDPLEALRLGHRVWVLHAPPIGLGRPLRPSGRPLRDPADPDVLALQAELLRMLGLSPPRLEAVA